MNFNLIKFATLLLLVITSACDIVKMKDAVMNDDTSEKLPVARALDKFLYLEDLEGISPPGISSEDSTNLIERYINDWIKKQLLIAEASKNMEFDEAEIERKILDYRYSLMGYEYQSFYVNRNLNTEVTEAEIKEYYDSHLENFELKQNIFKGLFVKIPLDAPQQSRLRVMVNSTRPQDREELKSYCIRFASSYSLEDSSWINFDDLIKDSQVIDNNNKVQFLRRNKTARLTDDGFIYLFKINEYRISDQISPMEFVSDQIRNIIINRRKVDLANNLEENVYKEAMINNDFEVYN